MHFEISAGTAMLAGLKKTPSGLVRHVRLGFSVLLVAAASAIRTGMAHPPHPFGARWCHGDTTFSPHGLSWHPLCHPSRCGGVPCHTPWHPSCICHLSLATSVVLRAPTACIKHLTLFYLSIVVCSPQCLPSPCSPRRLLYLHLVIGPSTRVGGIFRC